MDLSTVNAVGLSTYASKPLLKIKDMNVNVQYPLVNIKAVHTTFGRAIVVETSDNSIFLPQRLSDELDDSRIAHMNKMQLAFIFRGTMETGKPNAASLVEFVRV
jgi:hypothetical protein